jgi:hypothetical protein
VTCVSLGQERKVRMRLHRINRSQKEFQLFHLETFELAYDLIFVCTCCCEDGNVANTSLFEKWTRVRGHDIGQ